MAKYFRRYKKRSSVKRARKPTMRKRVGKTSRSFTKAVKRVIHRMAENKILSSYGANQTLNYAGSITNPTYLNLTPTPSVGASVQQRIGNQIRVVKGRVNGFVNVRPYDGTQNTQPAPVMIKMWLCKRVSYNNAVGGVPGTTDFSNFFQAGSTSVGFQSNMLDMTLRSNSEYWTVYARKTVTLQNSYYAGSTAPTTTILGSAYKVHAPFSFSFANHLGLCKYNDGSTYPNNKELFLVFQPVYADGSSSVSTLNLAEVHYNIEWQFEDL